MHQDGGSSEAVPLLEIEKASVMRGERIVLDRLSLRIDAGQHSAIVGRNGSGKSTLVQLIARQLYPLAGGTVRIFGRERWRVHELRGLLGIVSPSLQSDFTDHGLEQLEVFEAVASGFFAARGLWHIHKLTDEMRARSHEALEQIGRPMATLSTGEARRVLIARALVHRPKALLLDEPCAGLDPATRRHFLERLREIARAGTTLVMVTHHIDEILPEIGTVAMLREGRLIHFGEKPALLTDAALSQVFDTPMHVERHGEWYWVRVE
jgi:iron complex transport system ATP-binding protein